MAEQLRISGISASLTFEQQVFIHAFTLRSEKPMLLVFDHADAPEAGTQVPGGTVQHGEAVERAALRELAEETGVVEARVLGLIGPYLERMPDGGMVIRHVAAVSLGALKDDAWRHVVTGAGIDAGLSFDCYLTNARDPVPLVPGQAEHLDTTLRRFLDAVSN